MLLASGDTQIDAAASAGLSATYEAPILLTPKHVLGSSARSFINDYDIRRVLILGESEAISATVEESVRQLDSVEVVRIGGADRYETAVLMAERTHKKNSLCDSKGAATILLSLDKSFADAIAIGPLAYALNIPILLTKQDKLPVVTKNFLLNADMEEVMIIGGTGSVSKNIEQELLSVGMERIVRITGENRYETAVEIAKEIAKCQEIGALPEKEQEDDAVVETFAIVNGEAATDGIVAGPILGSGIDGDAVVPILLTDGEDIDETVKEFLGEIPSRTPDGIPIDVGIVPIGGEDVVPDSVVEIIEQAAITSDPILARIEGLPRDRQFTIIFSAPVDPITSQNPDHYLLSGVPLSLHDTFTLGGNVLTVNLAHSVRLVTDDTITVLEDKITGINGDHRFVQRSEYLVPNLTYSLDVRPQVKILAAPNAYEFRVEIHDDDFISVFSSFTVTHLAINDKQIEPPLNGVAGATYIRTLASTSNVRSVLICLFGNTGTACNTAPLTGSVPETSKALLKAGDVITVNGSAFIDRERNQSGPANYKVKDSSGAPVVTRVIATEPKTYKAGGITYNAKWEWALYDAFAGGNLVENYLTIEARPLVASVAGANGNAWRIQWAKEDGASSGVAEVRISLTPSREIIQIYFDEDATLRDVAIALSGNGEINDLFTVSSDTLKTADFREIPIQDVLTRSAVSMERGKPSSTESDITGGLSVTEMSLYYNQVIRSFAATGASTGFEDSNDELFLNSALSTWFAPGPTVSVDEVIYRIIGRDADRLPKADDSIVLPAGLASSYTTSSDSSVLTNSDGYLISASVSARTIN